MPRKSLAELSTRVVIDVAKTKLSAPKDLSPAALRIWESIVSSTAPEHFRASDVPLLKTYCEASALADRASATLAEEGPITDGKVSPWLKVSESSARSQATLAVRLRLCPSSRLDAKTAAREKNGYQMPGLPPWERTAGKTPPHEL